MTRVAVVVPVYRNAATLPALVDRLGVALADRDWWVRLVVDGCPAGSADVARSLAGPRVGVTVLSVNGGQHAALRRGLADEPDADAWVCLDADLQDPPEAVPLLLDRLAAGDAEAVFAGRRGAYESWLRRVTGGLHRRVAARLTGLPPDAGAFLALGPAVRAAVLASGSPSVVLAVGVARQPVTSVPVARAVRPEGRSAWTARARLGQSVRSLGWALRQQ
ncbi:undecaprenyl-phosphate 4-deoxy-4-formamido-L-arabinose transferase [Geodermatophilus obscurus]|uniref:Undecaprenyl-phosphate 4-deoxy-4-formamido-L-arabinose transferase n=1 Tax=Geodermatophilus obscurus TaxID=1861 RepID=A0A1M7TIE1_9ACTN|nr:glycosyltransferase [Geodermatophilus obscurus]SHN70480.1 undecaprenyl-phosphate 4-deoxy-4-formamido-L-arabinose transferase [Geodermatophilus obscurus]